MRDQLIKHHTEELAVCREGLRGWADNPPLHGDEKSKREHVATFAELVSFHEEAVKWLAESKNFNNTPTDKVCSGL